MTRRQIQQGDSLEMLLDTMCNTFGGIILIALLIALLARDSRVSEAQAQSAQDAPGSMEAQLAEASRELEAAKSLQSRMERKVQSPETSSALGQMKERSQLRLEAESMAMAQEAAEKALREGGADAETRMKNQLESLAETIRQAQQASTSERGRGASLRGRLHALVQSNNEASNRLSQLASQHTQRLRLPSEHDTAHTHLYIILRHGRAYPLYFFQEGVPERNTLSLKWEQVSANTRRIEPIPGMGIDPAGSPADLDRLLSTIPMNRFYIIFQVYEDSFAAFNLVKPKVIQRSFEYTWEPRREDSPMLLGPSGSAPRPQ